MTPAIQVPADTRRIPALLSALKRTHDRTSRGFRLIRLAHGHRETTLAMQGMLLLLAQQRAAVYAVAEAYDLPLDELVRSGIDPTEALVQEMERFIHPIIEGELA